MNSGIVLVHGYSGSPDNLEPLSRRLSADFGAGYVTVLSLPGHSVDRVPLFDARSCIQAIGEAAIASRTKNGKLILLGHSTGGLLALAALAERSIVPDLLILAAVPKKIDATYLERWSAHREGRHEVPFSSVAGLVSFINATGSRAYEGRFPVLVLHGEMDELVPAADAAAWEQNNFSGPVRTVLVPGAGHHVFSTRNSSVAVDVVARAVADAATDLTEQDEDALGALYAVEPAIKQFLAQSPSSRQHLARCPGNMLVSGKKPLLPLRVATEPVFANIEITTRCNLRCTHCARSTRDVSGEDMSKEVFRSILGLLPHAYRITLVGLGETLLHPQLVDLVAEASSQGRRVALVTNAMLLEEQLARELLNAGLESIAFSLDGATQEIASAVRPGTDLERVIANIKAFVELSKSTRLISMAIFSAISTTTVASLTQLMDVVAGLGVHVMMLSDLNFKENLGSTIWKNASEENASFVRNGVVRAFKKNLPVLSVHGLEEFGLWDRYGKFLLMPPERLYQRSAQHTWCLSPWQTIPVGVRGDVTLCDCQPGASVGSLLTQPLEEIWNGEAFKEHRRLMLSQEPADACRICPRF